MISVLTWVFYTKKQSGTLSVVHEPSPLYCGVPGSPCLSKTGLIVARIFCFFSGIHLGSVRPSPPVDGLKGPWPVSRRCPEPRRFFGDPALLAHDNIIAIIPKSHLFTEFLSYV